MLDPRVVVVIPAGPRDDIEDTLRSVVRYSGPERVVVIDDTKGRGIDFSHEKLTIIPAAADSSRFSTYGQLFVSLSAAYRQVVETIEFDMLLRLDADALLLGEGLFEAAWRRFDEAPRVGVLGAYQIGPDGGARNWMPARRIIEAECGLHGLQRPKARKVLRRLVSSTETYIPGEHVLGAAAFYRRDIMQAMYERGLLSLPDLVMSKVPEDHLFGLLAAATGFSTADFSGPDDPMAVRQRGLPASPDNLVKAGKLVTHSVRSWQEMDEQMIRDYFAERRG